MILLSAASLLFLKGSNPLTRSKQPDIPKTCMTKPKYRRGTMCKTSCVHQDEAGWSLSCFDLPVSMSILAYSYSLDLSHRIIYIIFPKVGFEWNDGGNKGLIKTRSYLSSITNS